MRRPYMTPRKLKAILTVNECLHAGLRPPDDVVAAFDGCAAWAQKELDRRVAVKVKQLTGPPALAAELERLTRSGGAPCK